MSEVKGMRGRRLLPAILVALLVVSAGSNLSAATKVKKLPLRYRTWIEEVELILRKEERKAFLALDKDYQRDAFIRQFWASRDPYPETVKNEFKVTWESRRADAVELFGDLTDERSRVMMLHGDPDLRRQTDCLGLTWPLDIWLYASRDRLPERFHIIFYQPFGGGPFRRWTPSDGFNVLQSRGRSTAHIIDENRSAFVEAVKKKCTADWNLVLGAVIMTEAQESTGGNIVVEYAPPVRDTEWLDSFLSFSTDLDATDQDGEAVGTLAAEFDFGFPAAQGQRTLVQGVVRVRAASATAAELLTGKPLYSFLLTGEVLRGGELFDTFRYQFDLPVAEVAGTAVPLVFERLLRPGDYRLILKLEDQNSGAQMRREQELAVPAVEHRAQSDPAVEETLQEAREELSSAQPHIEIVQPEGDVLTGGLRLEAEASGEGIRKVRFSMDGKELLTKTRPPYSVDLLLGDLPRTHQVTVVALDVKGYEIARDQVTLNGGTQRFSVRLVEPKPGSQHTGSLTAIAEVQVPDGRTLEKVELFLDDRRVATLFQPPFRQPMRLASGGGTQVVRAVAHLSDATSTESTALINAPGYTEGVEVRMVELYAAVLDRAGRPVLDLKRDEFSVRDGGAEQNLLRFDRVANLPIHAVLLLDTSASMAKSLPQAQRAAVDFLEETLTPRDRAAVITFSDRPLLVAKFTNDLDTLAGALAGLRAERGTGLYDSVVYGLQYLKGIRGQRTLLLLTDGSDRASSFTWRETLEFSRRSGVTVYSIGLGIRKVNLEARGRLDKLAEETGGRSFFIDEAEDLVGVYAQIQEELRARYLLAYQPPNIEAGGDFRPIEVDVSRPGLKIETIKGYYP